MLEPLSTGASVVRGDLPTPADDILVDTQPLQSYRAARMDLVCADPNLCAESEAHAICHSGARIVKDTRAVDGDLELPR